MSQTSLKRNFAYKSVLTVSNYLMAFITFPYVSRILGVERIGLVNFVDNTVNYFLLFASMGIGIFGVREIAAVKNEIGNRNIVYSRILGLNLQFTFGALIVYWAFIQLMPHLQEYKSLFYIGSAKILFTAFVIEWFYTGIEQFKYISLRNILVKAIYVIAVFLFVRTTNDYTLYFILTVNVVVMNALINSLYARRYVHILKKEIFSLYYLKQNVSLGIYTIMTSMYLTFNVMFLGFVSNNIEVGYYTTAFKLYTVILSFFTAFTNVMLPRMSAIWASGNDYEFNRLIQKSISLFCVFTFPIMAFGIVLAPQIILLLSGRGYEGAILPMRIIMPAIFFVGMAQILAVQILMPMKKDGVLLKASIIGASISLLLNIFIVSSLHSIGTAIVLLVSECLVTLTYMCYVLTHKLVIFPIKKMFLSIINGVLIGILLYCVACYISFPLWTLVGGCIIVGGNLFVIWKYAIRR